MQILGHKRKIIRFLTEEKIQDNIVNTFIMFNVYIYIFHNKKKCVTLKGM